MTSHPHPEAVRNEKIESIEQLEEALFWYLRRGFYYSVIEAASRDASRDERSHRYV